MDWIQQWQSKLNKQNGVAPLVRTGGSRHTGLAALPYRNIHLLVRLNLLPFVPTSFYVTIFVFSSGLYTKYSRKRKLSSRSFGSCTSEL